jgi:hypothetical protein
LGIKSFSESADVFDSNLGWIAPCVDHSLILNFDEKSKMTTTVGYNRSQWECSNILEITNLIEINR